MKQPCRTLGLRVSSPNALGGCLTGKAVRGRLECSAMGAGQLRTQLLGWGLISWSIIQALSLVIGIAGMPDDIKTWATRWLPSAWNWASDLPIGLGLVISLLLFVVGILLLAREGFEPIPTWYRHATRLVRHRPWRRVRAGSDESPSIIEDTQLGEHEAAALRVVAQHVNEPYAGITPYDFHQRMAQRGFSAEDSNLALASLEEDGMLERFEYEEPGHYPYWQYRLTSTSTRWLNANRAALKEDDDIPF